MCPVIVQPKNCRHTCGPCPVNGKFHPILNRGILSLAHSPNITLFYRVFNKNLSRIRNDLYSTISSNFKCLVMRTIFFGLLGHQPHIGDASHGRWIKGSMFLTKINSLLINSRIRPVRNHSFGVLRLASLIPHLSGSPDHGRHGCINNHITGYMKIGNAFIRIHHS